ncbi:MAG: SPFH domain-containing protein, partial [Bacteroidales bacterium]|nr:SPFH domain-containing protein [Bacteroidales bacterium]
MGVLVYLIFFKFNNYFNKSMSQTINIDPISGAIKGTKKIFVSVLISLAIIIFLVNAIRIVDAGETGVYSLFGQVKDNEVKSGIHVINPFAKITPMSIRTEEYTMSITKGEGKISGADAITSLTKEGLSVDLDMTVLYRIEENKASDIYETVGLNFEDKILRPSIRTSIRDVIAQYEAKDIYSKIAPNQKDAYYQLVYHPVVACANLNALYLAHAKNSWYARQGRAATNDMAQEVKELFRMDSVLTDYYHTKLANGKWKHMMAQTHIGYDNWQQPEKNKMPEVKQIELPEKGKLCFTIEGNDNYWPAEMSQAKLPNFDSFNKQVYDIELYNTGKAALEYQLSASDSWVVISAHKGKLEKQTRISISIDWDKVKTGLNQSVLKIKSDGNEYTIELVAQKFDKEVVEQAKGFIINNGYISIEASSFSRAINSKTISWEIIPGLGRTKSGVSAFPVTEKVEKAVDGSPALEYDFYLPEKPKNGKLSVNIYLSPTLNFPKGKGLHYAVSIDNELPQLINMHQGTEVADWKYPDWWNQAVLNNIIIKTSEHVVNEQGRHVLKFWRIDPGIVLQKIVIDAGGLKASYLGPPESIQIN